MFPQEIFEIYDICDCFWWLLRPHLQTNMIKIVNIIMVGNFQGGGRHGVSEGNPLVPQPLNTASHVPFCHHVHCNYYVCAQERMYIILLG